MNSKISFQELKNKMYLYLTYPGNGVYTVHTARDKKERLYKSLYKQTENIETIWKSQIETLPTFSTCILGIPSDNGGGIQRGANWGPLFSIN